MTILNDFYRKDCDKLDGSYVKAYMNLIADPELPTGIILENTWGDTGLDLEEIIKAGESDTTLSLAPSTADTTRTWTYLQYDSEKHQDCIQGDDLSRIISMQYLKDVDQTTGVENGDIYVYNGTNRLFYTFNFNAWKNSVEETLGNHTSELLENGQQISDINTAIANINTQITNLRQRVSALETLVENHENRIAELETLLTKPAGIPNDAVVAWGNRNVYGDSTNTDIHNYGIFTHSTSTNLQNDLYFA